eukprot:115268_1
MSSTETIIQRLDRGLTEYYKSMGRTDYLNEDGDGIFKCYCDENGFTDQYIKVELQEPAVYNVLVDFDADEDDNNTFPINGNFRDDTECDQAILNILQHIADTGKPPSVPNKKATNSSKKGTKLKINLYIPEDIEKKK